MSYCAAHALPFLLALSIALLSATQLSPWKADKEGGFERWVEKELYGFSGKESANPGDVLFRIAAFDDAGQPMQLLVYWYVGQDSAGITLRRKEGFGFRSLVPRFQSGVARGMSPLESLYFASIAESHLAKVDYEEFRLPPPPTVLRVPATASTTEHLIAISIVKSRDTSLRATLLVGSDPGH